MRTADLEVNVDAKVADVVKTDDREWLVTDGLGGFASGAADGTRRRREHGLLVVADPASGRHWMLVPAVEAWIETEDERIPLSTHRYFPDVAHPDGAQRIVSFAAEPWPTWRYRVRDASEISHEVMTTRGRAATFLSWKLTTAPTTRGRLMVRPLFAARALEALHRENTSFRFEAERRGDHIWRWTPYDGVPPIVVHANATYHHEPAWYRSFAFDDAAVEDLASPGVFSFTLDGTPAELLLSVPEEHGGYHAPGDLVTLVRAVRGAERARIAAYPSRLHHSADAFVVQREGRQTIVASYPPAIEDARVALAAVRGLCIHAARLDEAEQVLLSWCSRVGALARGEHRVPDDAPPQADAPLWYVVATQEFLLEASRRGHWMEDAVRTRLTDASQEVLDAYAHGTPGGVRLADDCLLAIGEPGRGLTWMGAGRVGKPVEVQALWINALTAGSAWSERWGDIGEQATKTFAERFWNEERACLYDVIDVDHIPGTADARVRPNQILAIGGLPAMVVTGDRARRAVETIERTLWTPMGLRTLAPGEPGYTSHSEDSSVDDGVVWPSLMAAFVDAWVRVRASERSSGTGRIPVSLLRWLRTEARKQFVRGFASSLETRGVGFLSSYAEAGEPFAPRGASFDALALSAAIRCMTE